MQMHLVPGPNNYNLIIYYNYNIIKLVPIHFIDYSLSKFNINCIYLGSYELRCNAAVTAYNKAANRLSSFNKQITDKSPGMYTNNTLKKVRKDLKIIADVDAFLKHLNAQTLLPNH